MSRVMQGLDSLELFDFGVLLQALSNNLKIGVLAVRSGNREKFLLLDRSTVRCVYTRKPRVSLQKVLYNHRSAQMAHLKAAADALGEERTEEQLAAFLLENGFVAEEALKRALNYQLVEEVLELFYWKSVGFEFYSGEQPESLPGMKDGSLRAVGRKSPVDTVLIQCTKFIDDIAKFNSVTPSLRDVYELKLSSVDELERLVPDPGQREFMLLIDGVHDMKEILRDMRMNRFEVLELFYRFRTDGRIRPKNSFELLMLAENRRSEFSIEKRARMLERVNELGVEGFDVLQPLAEAYETQGRTRKAAVCFVRHARACLASNDVDLALKSARRATGLVRDDSNIRRFEIEVLQRAGLDTEAASGYKALAEVLHARGELVEARQALQSAARLATMESGVWRRLGELLAEEGHYRPGAMHIRRAGDLRLKEGDPRAAAECFRRALSLWPRAWSARFRLVTALHAGGRDDVAVQELANLVEFFVDDMRDSPKDLRLLHLGRVEQVLRDVGGMASSAARQLGLALRQLGRPAHAAAILAESGNALVAAGRWRSAVEAYADLVELRPDDVDARRAWARSHAALGDRNRALAQLRRVAKQVVAAEDWAEAHLTYVEMLNVDPACLDAHCGVAQSLLHLGEDTAAAEHFHRASLLHRGSGRAAEAVPFLREAVEKRPADVDLLDEYCELLLAVGEDEQELLKALNALVDLRMRRGEHAQAAIALTLILTIDARYPGAKAILIEAAAELRRLAEESEEISPEQVRAVLDEAREAATDDSA